MRYTSRKTRFTLFHTKWDTTSRVLLPLAQEQGRDQEPAENKEDVDSEEAAFQDWDTGMKRHDGEDGDTANAVKRGRVPELEVG